MNLSRRKLMAAGFGATQLALLSRCGLLDGRARALADADRPSKLLIICLDGGIHNEFLWASMSDAALARLMPPADRMRGIFYDASMVENLDGSGNADADAPIRRLRAHVPWNWADPSDVSMGEPSNKGYAWAYPEWALYENTAIIHGVDMGTAAHGSGRISALSGIPTAGWTVPSLGARIANHFLASKPDRVVPNVAIGQFISAPAVTVSSAANSATVNSVQDLEFALSDRRPNWNDLRARDEVRAMAFDGSARDGTNPLTVNDAALLEAIRAQRFLSSVGTDTRLEELYETYASLSRTLARDVLDTLERTPAVEHLPAAMPWTPNDGRFGWRIPPASAFFIDSMVQNEFDLTLKFLKSDLTTSVSFMMPSLLYFDSHYADPFPQHCIHLRGVIDVIGRLIAEMKLTPSPSRSDRTLLDETLVYITSEFGRTFPITGGSDHFPIHSAVLVNGLIQGNRMIGSVGEDSLGTPVLMRNGENKDQMMVQPPTSRDVIATISECFGLGDRERFMPGGYGIVEGIVPT
jgi:hypothetical protein